MRPAAQALLLAASLCLAGSAQGLARRESRDPFAVAAYLPEWRYEGANWETICEHVTHLILFSIEPRADGSLGALDRIPRKELLAQARAAATKHDTKLLICFGGNGRSDGFSAMVRSSSARQRFVQNLVALCARHGFDGVDYNWEYPGYRFGTGYLSEAEVAADYEGLFALLAETRKAYGAQHGVITMAYYPDTRQEALLTQGRAPEHADLLHMMSYDQGGAQHSSMEFGVKAVAQGVAAMAQGEHAAWAKQLTMGVPFYGRHSSTGDWKTYEDIVQKNHPLPPHVDDVPEDDPSKPQGTQGFNGVTTMGAKVRHALEQRIGGVMIWEVGQDCRVHAVRHGDTTHVATCPNGEASSLLLTITRTVEAFRAEGAAAKGPEEDLSDKQEL